MKFGGIILEGVTGTGKSTLFKMLRESNVISLFESTFFIPQVYTLRLVPNRGEAEYMKQMLEGIHAIAGAYTNSSFASREDRRGSACSVFEGFHYYMKLDRPGCSMRATEMDIIESQLSELGVRLVVLTVSKESVMENCVLSPIRNRGNGWKSFLSQFGSCEEEWEQYFWDRQERLLRLVHGTRLPILHIGTSSQKWDEYLREIEAWISLED